MTGRAAGYCMDYSTPGFANLIPGRGFLGVCRGGFGGGGRGHRNMYYATGLPGRARFGGVSFAAPYEVQHLRLSFCVPEEMINKVFDRMEEYFKK